MAFDLTNEKLHKVLRIFVDKEEINIPKKVSKSFPSRPPLSLTLRLTMLMSYIQVRSIVIMNLPTYGGGHLWGSRSSFLEDFRYVVVAFHVVLKFSS